ncbi:hypothetical protein CI610_02949 [invertebrate metagenome]|uniref:Uncharacterized protein n=1 Tax=invertebrate metagenome TaxID=1711999 RepID=A0A2H9T4I1_9ZZZZ
MHNFMNCTYLFVALIVVGTVDYKILVGNEDIEGVKELCTSVQANSEVLTVL